jgi:hypothetical protein
MIRRSPICPEYNRLVLAMAACAYPKGFDIADSRSTSDSESFADIANRGRMVVWAGASDRTMYCDARINFAARAWHDSHHIATLAGFTYCDESRVCVAQCDAILDSFGDNAWTRRFALLTRIEVVGQLDYAARCGTFPSDQWEFTRETMKGLGL